MAKSSQRIMAYCYASGLIEFGEIMPDGARLIARGQAKKVRDFIGARARHGYSTRRVAGRLTKIPGSEKLLVPGVSEAPDQFAAVDALTAWRRWLREGTPKGVSI